MSAKPAGPRLLGPNSSAAERSETDCAERRQLGDRRWTPKSPAAAAKTTTQTSAQMRATDARGFAGAVSWSMHPRCFDGGAGVLDGRKRDGPRRELGCELSSSAWSSLRRRENAGAATRFRAMLPAA